MNRWTILAAIGGWALAWAAWSHLVQAGCKPLSAAVVVACAGALIALFVGATLKLDSKEADHV